MAPEPDEKDEDESRGVRDGQEDAKREDESGEGEEEGEEEEDEDEEPILKYAKMTGSLGRVYRNGDATSAFLAAGDKMIIGTHNGNVHVLSLPTFAPLRVYRAHSASVTAISISPFSPPPGNGKSNGARGAQSQDSPRAGASDVGTASSPQRSPQQQPVPITPSNSIHIATSSMDGNVCVASLVDSKDVVLRNFARPVQSVALSPTYKTNRTYLSGGPAGKLILTVGGRAGTSSTSSTSGGLAAASSGWLSSVGLNAGTAKDTVLHSGEGSISTIKWSLTGKYVMWVNEQGIKIMRSNHLLESADSEFAWKRISHIDHPSGSDWDEMSGVWKARAEWIDDGSLESDDSVALGSKDNIRDKPKAVGSKSSKGRGIEKLTIGWGGTVWLIHVHPGGTGIGKNAGERSVGRAEIVTILRTDCIISGLSLYTPKLLLVLAYITPEDANGSQSKGKEVSQDDPSTTPRRGAHNRQSALAPELRLIDLETSEEISADSLSVSRYGGLSASDYLLGVIPAMKATKEVVAARGTFDAFGGSIWTAGMSATGLFGSGASVRSSESQSEAASLKGTQTAGSKESSKLNVGGSSTKAVNPAIAAPGIKIFIHSPYDCVLATKRDLRDHLAWLIEREHYSESWALVDSNPEIVSESAADKGLDHTPSTPTKKGSSVDEFYADDASTTDASALDVANSAVEKEKRRIGELWVAQLLKSEDWVTAGEVCGKVLNTSSRWEHWIWVFVESNRFDDISPFIPTEQLQPRLPSLVYEVVLAHYVNHDLLRFKDLLDRWPPELFDTEPVSDALEEKLRSGEVREDTVEDGEAGRDWRILNEGLAKLFFAKGLYRRALKHYIKLQDADAAFSLIRDYHLLDAVADDIPGLVKLRVSRQQMEKAPISELEEATSEAIGLLVDEAQHGIVHPEVVVNSLEDSDHDLFLFFYLRALWTGSSKPSHKTPTAAENFDQDTSLDVESGKSVVESFSDLAVSLFAEYDRPLLMEFLTTSDSYTFETASAICERRSYIPESVYLLSKTGQTKRALFLIIDKLDDVSQAISFAKSQDDPDLWNDLLEYSMNKPRFILGLLQQVGTAIDPIELVRRIPKGLEIEGLRDGLSKLIREYEIQYSISEGAAKILRGEVAVGMDTLRMGQRRGVKFEAPKIQVPKINVESADGRSHPDVDATSRPAKLDKGHCTSCADPFSQDEKGILVGFACGHIYHLSCLLDAIDPTRNSKDDSDIAMLEFGNDAADTNDGDADSGGGAGYGGHHSVGAKVTHARIIRDRIKDGCPVCGAKQVAA